MKTVLLHWVGRYWWLARFTPGRGYYPVFPLGEGSRNPPHAMIDNQAGLQLEVHYR